MGFAIEMYFDPGTDARFEELWKSLFEAEINPVMPTIGSRPHISLAVFEHIDPVAFHQELRGIAEGCSPLAITFAAVGSFPTEKGVVFLMPVVTEALFRLHGQLHRYLSVLGIASNEYYCPGNWMPHATVAINLPPEKVAAAVEICRRSDIFKTAYLVQIGLIDFRPIREIYMFPLGEKSRRIDTLWEKETSERSIYCIPISEEYQVY
jgi:2'-5' RNA ligase